MPPCSSRSAAMAAALGILLLGGCFRQDRADEAPPNAAASSPLADAPAAPPRTASPSAQAEAPAPEALAAVDPALAVEGEGLRLFNRTSGRASPIPFGTARAEVERALAFRGPPGTGTQQDCGAGPLTYAAWPDGLKLYYQASKFAGWALDGRAAGPNGPAIGTAAGVGPGATRAQLTDASVATFEQTSLGLEFRSGAISGIVNGAGPTARITAMWAGVSCVFR